MSDASQRDLKKPLWKSNQEQLAIEGDSSANHVGENLAILYLFRRVSLYLENKERNYPLIKNEETVPVSVNMTLRFKSQESYFKCGIYEILDDLVYRT